MKLYCSQHCSDYSTRIYVIYLFSYILVKHLCSDFEGNDLRFQIGHMLMSEDLELCWNKGLLPRFISLSNMEKPLMQIIKL